jgi:hypothetical protein
MILYCLCSLQTQSTPIPDVEEIGMTLQQKQCIIAQLQKVIIADWNMINCGES